MPEDKTCIIFERTYSPVRQATVTLAIEGVEHLVWQGAFTKREGRFDILDRIAKTMQDAFARHHVTLGSKAPA